MLLKKYLVLLIILSFYPLVKSQVIINEFMAKNVTVDADNIDYDDYSDWIELYNAGNTTVNLAGYYLTDNLNNPTKWAIPDGAAIASHGFLVFRADGFDAAPGKVSTREFFPWGSFTTVRYHTNFKLDVLGEEIGLYKASGTNTESLIGAGSEWKYLDDGSNQNSAWKETAFNDNNWKSGFAQFGYGDGDEITTISYGSDANNKFITTYFRKSIQINNISNIQSLSINLLLDDGAIIYLNGHEILRNNMPTGSIVYDTPASSAVGEPNEGTFFPFDIPKDFLVQGTNVFSVEVHQSSEQSSDVSFDMQVNALVSVNSDVAQLVDSVKYNHQLNDVSLGRNPNDNNNWYYYGEPTPGAANATTPTLSTEFSGTVSFSLNEGFYNGQQALTLSAPGSEIYYTTDGSIPTTKSLKYISPVIINKTTVIRTRAYSLNKLPGKISSNNYFISEVSSTLPVMSLITDPGLLWNNQTGIFANNIKGREFPLTIEYFQPDGSSKFKVNAGARLAGLDIWSFAQKPLNIYLDADYGNDVISYRMFPGKTIASFTNFELRNGGDNWKTSFIPDDLAESIIKGQMPQVAFLSYRPCILYLNGEYWGIYDLRERSELQYFASNFNVDPSSIEYLGYVPVTTSYSVGLDVFEGTADSYNSFLSYIQNNDLSIKENYELVISQMDINSFIDYVSTEVYTCNTSWKHNREWWRSTTGDGKWRWLMQDIDRGFNSQNLTRNILSDYVSGYPILNKLLKYDEFKNKFIQQFAAHLNSTFTADRITNIVDSLSKEIRPEMPRHIERWKNDGGIQSMTAWENEINNMKLFASGRVNNVLTQINSQFSLTGTYQLNINLSTSNSGKILVNGIPLCGSLSGLKFFKNIPMQITAIPNNGFRFTGWGNNFNDSTITLTIINDTSINALFEPSNEIILPAKIETNTVLAFTENVYVANGDITIEPGKTLTIEKGVNIRMPESSGIYVKGNLVIEGTEDQPVSILPNKKAGAEKWGALCFDNSTGNNVIKYLNIKGATVGKDAVNQKAAISCFNSNVVLDHLNIEDVNFPIFALNGSTVLRNSTLSATGTCDYIGIKRGLGLVENNIFYGNKSPDTDAIDFDGDDGGIIRGNKIYNFTAFNCDGIDIGEECKNILITGNVIYNSKDKGISVGQLSTATIEKNIIVGCDMGVAVKDISQATIINNTFFRNNYAVACYEKNYGEGGGFADVKNSILSASKNGSLFADSLSSITISYSFSDMDILPGLHNLFGDPLFTDMLNYNLQLRPGSPCLNSGDPGTPQDPDGSIADIGAYYVYNENDINPNVRVATPLSVVINEIMYNDSGTTNSKDWIELYNPTDHSIDISGWKITDEDTLHLFDLSSFLNMNPKEYLVVCKDSADFTAAHPDVHNFIGNFDFGFDGNDKVVLLDNNNNVVNFITYKNSEPWASADGNGSTLELRNPFGLNYQTINWKVSEGAGTPGKQNSVYEPTEVKQVGEMPSSYKLEQNYPNPFNPVTTISYSTPVEGKVKLIVYDILGKEITFLVNEEKPAGNYAVRFNAANLSSGIYFYRIEAGEFMAVKKLVLLK